MKLIDSTLREGEQCFGVYFTPQSKKDILGSLARLGVEEAELGVAGRDAALADLMAWGKRLPVRPLLSVWAACREQDLRAAAVLEPDRLHIGLPVSDPHITTRLGLDREALLKLLDATVGQARTLGFTYVSLGLEDASRADPAFVLRAALAARDAGASRVRLSDTVGVWNPLAVAERVSSMRQALGKDVDIGLHCHNDFGLGTANALAGLMAGAQFADASVLGLGERAGLAATEELAAYLALRMDKPYAVVELRGLCRTVAQAAGVAIPPRKAIAGEGLFACETGLHVHALAKDPTLFEPFAPETFGLCRAMALGKKSGRAAVAAKAQAMGMDLARLDLEALVAVVRTQAEKLGRPLTEAEAEAIFMNWPDRPFRANLPDQTET